jgi:integrase/recombinase XerD
MGEIRDRMREDLVLAGFAPSTQRMYLQCARRFAEHFHRSPAEMGEREVREYLLHLVQAKKVGPATHQVHLASLNFLYRRTLGRPEEVERIPWPRVPRRLPVVPTGEQVRRVFEEIRSIKHRAILMAAYGGGLRISEACSLEIQDIDSNRMLIHVRHAKRSKDRYVMLSRRLLHVLRQYWIARRPPGPGKLTPKANLRARRTQEPPPRGRSMRAFRLLDSAYAAPRIRDSPARARSRRGRHSTIARPCFT